MTIQKKLMCSSVALLALVGCGSSDPSLISASEEVLRIFADTDGDGDFDQDLGQAFENGEVLIARQVNEATLFESFADGEGYVPTDAEVSFQLVDGDLIVSISVPEREAPYQFALEDAALIEDNFIQINPPGGDFLSFSVRGGLNIGDIVTPGNGFSVPIDFFITEDGDNFGIAGFAVIGTETTDAMLAEMTSEVFYDGYADLFVGRQDQTFNEYRMDVFTDVDIVVDFDAGTISGEMTNIAGFEAIGGDEAFFEVDGKLLMNETSLIANAFSGTVTADAELLADSPELAGIGSGLNYSGAFFGPDGREVAGTYLGEATIDEVDYSAHGIFQAFEPLP